jgi:hypothetical protein
MNFDVSIAHNEVSFDREVTPSCSVARQLTPQCAEKAVQGFHSMSSSVCSAIILTVPGPVQDFLTAQDSSSPFQAQCMQLSIDHAAILLSQTQGADISFAFKSSAVAVCGSFESRVVRGGNPGD